MFKLRIKELRESKGWSQKAMAEKFGCAQSTIGMWESGKNKPDIDTLSKLADFFNCSTDFLLGRVNDPNIEIIKTALPDGTAVEYAKDRDVPELTPEEIIKLRDFLRSQPDMPEEK